MAAVSHKNEAQQRKARTRMDDREVASCTCKLLEAALSVDLLQEGVEYCTLGEIWVHSFGMLRKKPGRNLD